VGSNSRSAVDAADAEARRVLREQRRAEYKDKWEQFTNKIKSGGLAQPTRDRDPYRRDARARVTRRQVGTRQTSRELRSALPLLKDHASSQEDPTAGGSAGLHEGG
jgi:hypothetical protein